MARNSQDMVCQSFRLKTTGSYLTSSAILSFQSQVTIRSVCVLFIHDTKQAIQKYNVARGLKMFIKYERNMVPIKIGVTQT